MQMIPETPQRHAMLETMLTVCLDLERQAVATYTRLSKQPGLTPLAPFFKQMAQEEGGHVAFWKALLQLAQDKRLRNPFDDPEEVLESLRGLKDRVARRFDGPELPDTAEVALLLAYDLEFSLLDPAFGTLFLLLAQESGETGAADQYQHHLEGLIQTAKTLGMDNAHFDLIARQSRLLLELNRLRARDLAEIYSLRNILPICMHCKKVREDGEHWDRVERYITAHTGKQLSHGICPDCVTKYYGDILEEKTDTN